MGDNFSVALDKRRGVMGCAGRNANCANIPAAKVTLTYCDCTDDDRRHSGCEWQDTDVVELCQTCTSVVSGWVSFTSLELIDRSESLTDIELYDKIQSVAGHLDALRAVWRNRHANR